MTPLTTRNGFFISVASRLFESILGSKAAGRFFNTAAGESISLLQLIAELNRLTAQSLEPEFHPPRVGDVRNSLADISAAREALGYEVLVDWQDGLARTLDFYRP